MKHKDLPKEIFFEEKVGSNGIHCLDYENETDIKYIRADVVAQMLVSGIQSDNGKLPIPHVRFQLPSDQQIVELAILFNDGNIDKEILTKMVSLADFIIDRLYENGDVSKPSSKEGN